MDWISVNERLPELPHDIFGNKQSDDVLATDGTDFFIANLEAIRPDFVNMYWYDSHADTPVSNWDGKDVTHWMPLPELPKEI